MNKRNLTIALLITLVASICLFPGAQAQSTLPAFPGAEGHGAVTAGGRGGQVIHVTNLNTSGPGSLQEACSTLGARIVVFDVSGYIPGEVIINYSNITIAGQTAPGAGITIGGMLATEYNPLQPINDIIIRHVRVRPPAYPATSGSSADGIQIGQSQRVILDHVSVAWGIDENIDMYETSDVTIQWCTIEEPQITGHPEGPHPYGFIQGPAAHNASILYNLFAHNKRRNPAIDNGVADIRNNLCYNMRDGLSHENRPDNTGYNIVGNYYKEGLDSTMFPFCFERKVKYYLHDNYIDSPSYKGVIEDPWAEAYKYYGLQYYASKGVKAATPFAAPAVTTYSSVDTYNIVLQKAGCFPRDVVTNRIVNEVQTRTGHWGYDGPADVMQGLTPGTAPADTDWDGMPDTWESSHGLNPNTADNNTIMASGYTAVEEYVNQLADSLVP